MGVRTANVQDGNIGETLTGLAEVIHGRRDASPQESYTARLLTDVEDELLKKLAEEASEVIMAARITTTITFAMRLVTWSTTCS